MVGVFCLSIGLVKFDGGSSKVGFRKRTDHPGQPAIVVSGQENAPRLLLRSVHRCRRTSFLISICHHSVYDCIGFLVQ